MSEALVANERPEHKQDLLGVIIGAAENPRISAEKVRDLVAVQKQVEDREAEREFNIAMNRAQAEVTNVQKRADNTQTHSKYARYEDLDSMVRPVYIGNGFALSFNTEPASNPLELRVLCYVSHVGGHTRTYGLDVPTDGKGPKGNDVMTRTHATISGVTYGKSCLLRAIFNIVTSDDASDDDGNRASGSTASLWWDKIEKTLTLDELLALGREMATTLGGRDKKFLRPAYSARKKELEGDSHVVG